jgi:aspartokinase-like uncharacterized kinase
MPFYVMKLGGSLMPSARELVRALMALAEEDYSFLVVPGGGPMADLVREIFSRGDLSEEAAHWMAILAMEQYAYLLADGTGARLASEIRRPSGVEVLLPYQVLQKDDRGLEHNWDYTSDSVAALVALRLDAPLIKATDVDGVILEGMVVREVSADHLRGIESCIDQGTLRLLQGRSIRVLNGTDPQRFVEALKSGEGGTIIRG